MAAAGLWSCAALTPFRGSSPSPVWRTGSRWSTICRLSNRPDPNPRLHPPQRGETYLDGTLGKPFGRPLRLVVERSRDGLRLHARSKIRISRRQTICEEAVHNMTVTASPGRERE